MIHISQVILCPYCAAGDQVIIMWCGESMTSIYKAYHVVNYGTYTKQESCLDIDRLRHTLEKRP